MNLQTITMDKNEARKAFLDYRRAVRERHSDEDVQIMRGYRAMCKGLHVIELNATMQAAGQNAQGWPRLAIARADERRIEVRRFNDGRLMFSPNLRTWRRLPECRSRERLLPPGTLGTADPSKTANIFWDASAMAPIIPPALRPAHHLRNYHIIWEAEWSKLPPRDPALLKHLGGTLYAVLATWDLSPVERAVLGLTRN